MSGRRLEVWNCYSYILDWVGWGARVSICSIDILRRRKLFYIRRKPWPPFYLRSIFIHCVGNSFMPCSLQNLELWSGHIILKKTTYLRKRSSPEFCVDLVSSLFFLWNVLYFFCLYLCVTCPLSTIKEKLQ